MMMKRILVLLLLSAGLATAQDLDLSALQSVAVQKDGRKKPLDTVAMESIQRITGKTRFKDAETGRTLGPMELLLSMWLETREWLNAPVIYVGHQPLKAQLGLPVEQKYFSYRQLRSPAFDAILERIARKSAGQQKPQLTREEREANSVRQRMQYLEEVLGVDSLAVVPDADEEKGPWKPVSSNPAVKQQLEALKAAFMKRDAAAFDAASRELAATLRSFGPKFYPSKEGLEREVHYNQMHPFLKAEWLYGLAFILALATWPAKNRAGYWLAMAAFVAGVAVHSYGFYLRILI